MSRTKKKMSAIEAFIALPDEEKERQWREFDKEFIADTFRPLTAAQRALWEKAKRRPGRPRTGEGSQVVSLSVERALLEKADAYARAKGISRSQLVAEALRAMMAPRRGGRRKSA
ncbi:MAG TPA: hypothetical protein VHQ47_13695 [Phycisphaerae bacterium]|nr:hypothetical protein [Phycisphaerae bacterium]